MTRGCIISAQSASHLCLYQCKKAMKFQTDLIQVYSQKLKGHNWYHQRFDGCPLFIFPVAEAEARIEARKPKGTAAKHRVCFFEGGKADWYLDMEDIERGAKIIVELAGRKKAISKSLLKLWKRDEQAFENFFWKKFLKISLKKLTDRQLLEFWHKIYNLYLNRFTSSSVIDHFALGTDELIGKMIRKEIGQVEKESEFTEIFSTLTAPVHQSFINRAEIDLLKIAVKQSNQSLADYQKKYYWTKNNYFEAKILSIQHFKEEINAWRLSRKDLKLELFRIENTPIVNRRKKVSLLKKLKLSRLLTRLLAISEDFSWWQDERKKSTYLFIDIGSKILQEIGSRKGYTLTELKSCLPVEIKSIMEKSLPSRKELQSRLKGSVMIGTEKFCDLKTGVWVEKMKKVILGSKAVDQVMDFRGLSASTGRAVGKAKIIKSATEAGKVKQGDILVAVMTRPDYVVAMKKASAIVTNEGGITSHAAIVSRELGIPCIIGTKIATEVLKDGDLVEVNANHGWVRKIK